MINLIILYWDMGCETRKQNTIVSWKQLKKLTYYLKNKGLNVNCYIFEFGENFIFEDSIKVNYTLGFFEKSKKINLVLNNPVNQFCKFIGIMDSDLFFHESQYNMLYEHIVELENSSKKIFFTYNLLDIHETERNKIINFETLDLQTDKLQNFTAKYSWRHSWGSGTLGGFFIAPYDELKKMGGFNENFLTWGVEDDEAFSRLKDFADWVQKKDQGPYHLWHPKNKNDNKYFIPVYSEEYFKINKIEKPK